MRTAATILTLTLFSLSAGAAEVYRTIDAQGNVVYSDRPEDASSVRVAVAVTQPRASVPARAPTRPEAAQSQEADEATIAAAERAQLAADRAANCAIARERSESFTNSHRLYRTGENGERVYFNDAETAQARLDAQAEVARWCG